MNLDTSSTQYASSVDVNLVRNVFVPSYTYDGARGQFMVQVDTNLRGNVNVGDINTQYLFRINGSVVQTVSSQPNWSTIPAVQSVNMNNYGLNNISISPVVLPNLSLGPQALYYNPALGKIHYAKVLTQNEILPHGSYWGDYLFWNGVDNYIVGGQNITLGANAGVLGQQEHAVAIGREAGGYNQREYAIALGDSAGRLNQQSYAVAIGSTAGNISQGSSAVSIGVAAGSNNQGMRAIAIGLSAGLVSQGIRAIALGDSAGSLNQQTHAVAIGYYAGNVSQGSSAVSVGLAAGRDEQGMNAIAIGLGAGLVSQGMNAIAIGERAGSTSQASNSIVLSALGNTTPVQAPVSGLYIAPIRPPTDTGYSVLAYNPTTYEVVNAAAAGLTAGGVQISNNTAGNVSIVANNFSNIATSSNYLGGLLVSNNTSNVSIVANNFSNAASTSNQIADVLLSNRFIVPDPTSNRIAIGQGAGLGNQYSNAIAIGYAAGSISQGTYSIAIGDRAGSSNQGTNAIAIGYYAGAETQHSNTIVLNATGVMLNTSNVNALYVAPIRPDTTTTGIYGLGYNNTTKEIVKTAVNAVQTIGTATGISNTGSAQNPVISNTGIHSLEFVDPLLCNASTNTNIPKLGSRNRTVWLHTNIQQGYYDTNNPAPGFFTNGSTSNGMVNLTSPYGWLQFDRGGPYIITIWLAFGVTGYTSGANTNLGVLFYGSGTQRSANYYIILRDVTLTNTGTIQPPIPFLVSFNSGEILQIRCYASASGPTGNSFTLPAGTIMTVEYVG